MVFFGSICPKMGETPRATFRLTGIQCKSQTISPWLVQPGADIQPGAKTRTAIAALLYFATFHDSRENHNIGQLHQKRHPAFHMTPRSLRRERRVTQLPHVYERADASDRRLEGCAGFVALRFSGVA